ncbi:MAG: LCP family protein [Lachnospiraceae bacterium]|nr:LCP family protein [Lachnospiraceae bacterium]
MEGIYTYGQEEKIDNEKKKKRKKRRVIIKSIVLAVLFICAAVAGNRVAALRWKIHGSFILANFDTNPIIQNVDKEALSNGAEFITSDDVINILLVGADKRESWADSGRSDSCMIATIDLKNKKLKLTSLMRDMYLDIPGKGKHKFNFAYSSGGVELLYKTILQHFGIKVDGYVIVDFAAFKRVINTLGGVNIELTDEEHEILMKRYHRTSVLDLKPGKNKMNGTQALAYCRLRQDLRADFGRTDRQRYVLEQIFKKMKKKPVNKWYDVLNAVMPEVTTDLSEDKIIEYMTNVIFLGTTTIDQLRIPVDGSFKGLEDTPDGDVLDIDVEKNREALKDFIFSDNVKKKDEK